MKTALVEEPALPAAAVTEKSNSDESGDDNVSGILVNIIQLKLNIISNNCRMIQ